ncbi:MAG: hypothetical protein H0V96_08590 [Acidimicrobiia bacterium]|nr:hypothetical protein [Acidimicrobiia bacterium]
MLRRTTVTAEADDLAVLKQEARRRQVSLSVLLGKTVAAEAATIRAGRRPRIEGVRRPVGIAQVMEEDPEAPHRSCFRIP